MTRAKKQRLPALDDSGKVKNPDLSTIGEQNYTSTVLKYANLALPFPQLETNAKRVVPAINELNGSKVTANPELPGDQDPLNTIQVGDTIYKVVGGGGGGDYMAGAGIYFTGDNNSVINADAGRKSRPKNILTFTSSYHSDPYQVDWVDTGTTVDDKPVYQSLGGTYQQYSGDSLCTYTISGARTFTIHIKQEVENSSYSYVVLGRPNEPIDLESEDYEKSYRGENIPDYVDYEYSNINSSGGDTTVQVLFHKEEHLPPIPIGVTLDLNDGQWRDTGTTVDGHEKYESDLGSWHVDDGASTCTLYINGVTSISLYVSQSSEYYYDYVYIGNLDERVSRSNYRNTTYGVSAGYITFTYECTPEPHFIQLMYAKDSSDYSGADRGYFYYVVDSMDESGAVVSDSPSGDFSANDDRAWIYADSSNPYFNNHGEVFNDYKNNYATGSYSHAEGTSTTAVGTGAHAEGSLTVALSDASHAEGLNTRASYGGAHAEGDGTVASGGNSHAEGERSKASAEASHAEGHETQATASFSHAEGFRTIAGGQDAHAENYGTLATGQNSHAEGRETKATNLRAHAEGGFTLAGGISSHAEGSNTIASGEDSHAEGYYSLAQGFNSHAEGYETAAKGSDSHSENYHTQANGLHSHAEGFYTKADGNGSHSEGYGDDYSSIYTTAFGLGSHAEGYITIASGNYSHVEGQRSRAFGAASHAENSSVAYGTESHSEGAGSMVGASYAHVEGAGNQNIATTAHVEGAGNKMISKAEISHTEGAGNRNYGPQSHLEGAGNTLSGTLSHVEGAGNTIHGEKNHAEGGGNTAYAYGSHIEGKHNTTIGAALHVEGRQNYIGPNVTVNSFTYGRNYSVGDIVGVNALYGYTAEYSSSYVYRCITAPGQIQSSSTIQIITPATWNDSTTYSTGSVVKRIAQSYGEPQFVGYYYASSESTGEDPMKGGNWTKITKYLSPFVSTSVYSDEFYLLNIDSELPYTSGNVAKILTSTMLSPMWEAVQAPIGTHVEGYGNYATGDYQHIQGKYNLIDTNKAFIIGNGTSDNSRSNALTVDWSGNTAIAGDLTTGTTLNTTAQTLGAAINEISVRVPAPPSTNGTYTLSVTVSNGVPTYNWVSS